MHTWWTLGNVKNLLIQIDDEGGIGLTLFLGWQPLIPMGTYRMWLVEVVSENALDEIQTDLSLSPGHYFIGSIASHDGVRP